MFLSALLLATAAPTAVDAERAFAAMAQTEGQWTAFRDYAAPQALMFVPAPAIAQDWLKGRKDPPVSVMWWPGRSWVSCDGTLAVNTGPWVRDGGRSRGTFTTVWQRQPEGGWKWLLDHGRVTPRAVPAGDEPVIRRPVCRGLEQVNLRPPSERYGPELLVQIDNLMPGNRLPRFSAEPGQVVGSGASVDGSLRWEAHTLKGGEEGAHMLRVWMWSGRSHQLVLFELTGVPAQ